MPMGCVKVVARPSNTVYNAKVQNSAQLVKLTFTEFSYKDHAYAKKDIFPTLRTSVRHVALSVALNAKISKNVKPAMLHNFGSLTLSLPSANA